MEDKKKILIVEDELPMLNALSDTFKDEGFIVIQAHDGEEGLESAKETLPDIILVDILMPKMDGMTMLKKLREDENGKNIPVIVLTNVAPDSNSTLNAVSEA